MAKLSKGHLVAAVTAALRSGGWVVEVISPAGDHPVRMQLSGGGTEFILRLYIWNLTHGGGRKRPSNEYRIQITSGVKAFEMEAGGRTLILGWSDQFGAFAAFDAARRSGEIGRSPSIQISAATLDSARGHGAALQDKGHGEFAVAVRPDHLPGYVRHIDEAHAGDLEGTLDDPSGMRDHALLDRGADGLVTFRPGVDGDEGQRLEILQRLAALEAQLAELRPATMGRGHNGTPELLPEHDGEGSEIVEALGIAGDEIRNEMAKPEPDLRTVSRGATFFDWFGDALAGVRRHAGELQRKVTEKIKDRAADLIVGVLLGAPMWPNIAALSKALAAEVARWIALFTS